MATATESITSIEAHAKTRGTMRYSMGSAFDMRRASTCSVTTIEPTSAAMPWESAGLMVYLAM